MVSNQDCQHYQTDKKRQIILLLAPLVFSFAIGQDIFVPEVPQLVNIFNTSSDIVQLTLSLFFLSVGLGQIIIGPISDCFGRKPIVLICATTYAITSLMAAFSPSITFLIIMRILQGIGACGMMVCSFAIVRDLYLGDESAQIYSYLNGAIAISPLFAPIVGGYLYVYFGWQSPFFALALIGFIIVFLLTLFLNETLKSESRNHSVMDIFPTYLNVLKNKQFLIFTFVASSALACFFTFFSISPYILIEILHVPETAFGFYFGFIGLVFFFGSMLAGKLNVTIGFLRVAIIGSILFFVSGTVMLGWLLITDISIVGFIFPTCISAVGGAFLMGAGAGGALEPFDKMAGTAAALLGASEFLLATVVGILVLLEPIESDLPFAITLITFSFLSIMLIGVYIKARNVSNKN